MFPFGVTAGVPRLTLPNVKEKEGRIVQPACCHFERFCCTGALKVGERRGTDRDTEDVANATMPNGVPVPVLAPIALPYLLAVTCQGKTHSTRRRYRRERHHVQMAEPASSCLERNNRAGTALNKHRETRKACCSNYDRKVWARGDKWCHTA